MGAGSQDSAHVAVGRAFALVGAIASGVAEREASGDFDYLLDDPDERDGWTGHDQALCRSPSKDTNPNRQASSITSRRSVVPIVGEVACVDHPYAQFTAEGDEIPEVLVHTAKVTQLVRLSNEQYNQTNTASQLAQTVSRAMARWANLRFVAEAAPTPRAVAPAAGLVSVANVVEGDLRKLKVGSTYNQSPSGWAELVRAPISIDRETEVTQVNSRGQSGTRRALTPTD